MQTSKIGESLAGLNRVVVTLKLTPETKEENEAILKTSTATADDRQLTLVEKNILGYYDSMRTHFVLINAMVKKDGTVDMVLEKTGGVGGI